MNICSNSEIVAQSSSKKQETYNWCSTLCDWHKLPTEVTLASTSTLLLPERATDYYSQYNAIAPRPATGAAALDPRPRPSSWKIV